jgi:hypothetical protein
LWAVSAFAEVEDEPVCRALHGCPPAIEGQYVCGDLGECLDCPDNEFCKDGFPLEKEKNATPVKESDIACNKFLAKKQGVAPDRLLMFCQTELTEEQCKTCLKPPQD